MEDFLQRALLFIDRWSIVLYAVGLLGVLRYLLAAREAFHQRRFTPFPIEREEASAMLRDSVVILIFLAAILATTFYIDRVLFSTAESATGEPSRASSEPTATATSPAIGVAVTEQAGEATPTSSDTSEGTEAATATITLPTEPAAPPEPQQEATPTESSEAAPPTAEVTNTPPPPPTATVVASPIPTQPPPPTETPPPPPTSTPAPPPTSTAPPLPQVPAARCNTPGVQIASPANGQVVGGTVSIVGTANIADFQFYKVEYASGTSGAFASIGGVVNQSVSGGQLATWNASGFGSGVWNLRLTVVDQTGNFPAPCDIYVIIP